MKKNLLALFALGAIYSANAQTTYVKDKAVVAIKPNTLLYMGNGLEVSSSVPNTIVNEGNIQINLSDLNGSQPIMTEEITPYFFRNYNTGKTYSTTAENVASDWNDGSNFVNKYNSDTSYGQVMFTMGSNINVGTAPTQWSEIDLYGRTQYNRAHGKLTLEQPYVNPTTQNWQVLAIPFISQEVKTTSVPQSSTQYASKSISVNSDGYTDIFLPENVMSRFYGLSDSNYIGDDSKSNARYNSTFMNWSNQFIYYRGVLKGNKQAFNTAFTGNHIANLNNGPLKTLFASNYTDTTKRISYKGTPFSFNVNAAVAIQSGVPYTSTTTWAGWKDKINNANEKYSSYIGESMTVKADGDTSYGKNLYNISNPYTHNVNVHQLIVNSNKIDDIFGVQKYGNTNLWKLGIGNMTPRQTNLKATKTTGSFAADWTGDKEALLLKPFEVLQVKLKGISTITFQIFVDDHKTLSTSLQRKDKIKTFDYSVQNNGAPLPKSEAKNDEVSTFSSGDISLYQLGVSVKATNSNTDGQRMYLVASNQDVTGQNAPFEARYNDYGNASGFWLSQEAKDGSYDQGTFMFINAFNMNDYVAKPLRMVFYKNPNDTNNKFTLNFNLAEGSTLNDGLEKLSNGNKYYLVDSQENKSYEITKDFEYNFTANESSYERFTIYWNALPASLGTGEVEVNKNKTHIYKNTVGSNSIRFAKNNLTANVKVYNMAGQLVLSKDNVTTSQDYIINNLENGMYIVNIQYSDNTVETLKSIFKK